MSSAYSSQVCASLCSRVPGAACFRIRHIFSPLSQEEGTVLEAFAHFSWLESARRGWPIRHPGAMRAGRFSWPSDLSSGIPTSLCASSVHVGMHPTKASLRNALLWRDVNYIDVHASGRRRQHQRLHAERPGTPDGRRLRPRRQHQPRAVGGAPLSGRPARLRRGMRLPRELVVDWR